MYRWIFKKSLALKEFSESAKRMSSANEFHSTGPAQEKDRRSYRSRLWRGTYNRALPVDLRARRGSYGVMSGVDTYAGARP